MATAAEIPIAIAPEALDRVRQLGMEREFGLMLEHTRTTIPDLQRIEVAEYDDPAIDPTGSRVVITAWKNGSQTLADPAHDDWADWVFQQFSPKREKCFQLLRRHNTP